jgi:hypothetical protein
MNTLQKIVMAILPPSWAKAAEAESRAWMLACGKCGHRQSVWDAGGIRWNAAGTGWQYRRCVACKQLSWQKRFRDG